MKLYNVKDDYIDFLKQYESKIAINKDEKRPYIGTVLKIDEIYYYAPISSPKEKHKNMKNSKDFRKINGGLLGAINFNNMIPIVENALILININSIQDEKYQRLLQNQYNYLNSDKENIKKIAKNLYNLCKMDDNSLSKYDLTIKNRCCNFDLLEKYYENYER